MSCVQVTGTANSLLSGASGVGCMLLPLAVAQAIQRTRLGYHALMVVTIAAAAGQLVFILLADWAGRALTAEARVRTSKQADFGVPSSCWWGGSRKAAVQVTADSILIADCGQ